MFDLFRSQQTAVRILLGVILGIVALSMLIYLIPGTGMSTGSRDDQVIADIGDLQLTVHDVDVQMQQILKSRQYPPEFMQSIVPQKIDEMTAERAAVYEAKRLGFEVTDKDLADAIRSVNPQIAALTPQQYRDYIETQVGQSVPEFEANLRLGLYLTSLENVAMQGVLATPSEVEIEYHKRNDKIKMEFIAFDPTKLAAGIKPSDAELKDYYDKNRGFFNTPQSRSLDLLVADPAKLGESVQISDNDVRKYYDSHKDQFRTQERVKARHILVMTQGKPADEVPKLKAKAEDLLKQVKAGGDFAKIAEKNSDDAASAKNGGDLGWVLHGQMVAEFEKATFALQPKEISGLVTTNYGFHIIQVLEKEPAHLRTLEEAKADITTALRNQAVADQMQVAVDQAHSELVKSPQNAAQIASKYHLNYSRVPKFAMGDALPDVGNDRAVAGNFAQLKPGQISDLIPVANKIAFGVVTAVQPSHPADFNEALDQVKAAYPQQKATQMAADLSTKANEIMKNNGGDLKAVAKALKLELKTSDFFSRNGAVEGVGAGAAFADLFEKPIGTVVGPMRAGGDTVITKLLEKQPADMSKLAADRDSIVTQIKGKKAQERQALMRDSILAGLQQSGKVKIHKAVVDRLIARYSSRS